MFQVTPWNVDTISKPGFTKTVLNVAPRRKEDEDLPEEEREKKMKEFVKQHEKELKQYGMFKRYDDSKRFLQEHLYLVSNLSKPSDSALILTAVFYNFLKSMFPIGWR